VRSAHPPERLGVELQSRLGPSLSHRGYRVVSYGPGGISWRRSMPGKVIAGVIVLGMLALGGLASGEAGSILLGLIFGIAAGLLVYFRRPAGVAVNFVRFPGGTEISVSGGPDVARTQELVRASVAPDASSAVPRNQEQLAAPIARLVAEAHARERRIREAIERAELPYEEVVAEVEGFIVAIDRTSHRAQLIFEALQDTPPAHVVERLEQVRADPESAGLADALTTQLQTLEHMQGQLKRFYAELERLLVELDTVRSQLISVSASSETAEQDRVADEVRALRERMGAVADSMVAAYQPPAS
jgi:hypothetical protein